MKGSDPWKVGTKRSDCPSLLPGDTPQATHREGEPRKVAVVSPSWVVRAGNVGWPKQLESTRQRPAGKAAQRAGWLCRGHLESSAEYWGAWEETTQGPERNHPRIEANNHQGSHNSQTGTPSGAEKYSLQRIVFCFCFFPFNFSDTEYWLFIEILGYWAVYFSLVSGDTGSKNVTSQSILRSLTWVLQPSKWWNFLKVPQN